MAVSRDDLVHRATELEAVQGIACRLVGADLRGIGKSCQQVRRSLSPGGGRLRERCDVAERRYRAISDLGYAMVVPADDCPVRLRGFEDNRTLVTAFDLAENVERNGNRVERVKVSRLQVFDGQTVVEILHPQVRALRMEHQRRNGAPVPDTQNRSAKDGTE